MGEGKIFALSLVHTKISLARYLLLHVYITAAHVSLLFPAEFPLSLLFIHRLTFHSFKKTSLFSETFVVDPIYFAH